MVFLRRFARDWRLYAAVGVAWTSLALAAPDRPKPFPLDQIPSAQSDQTANDQTPTAKGFHPAAKSHEQYKGQKGGISEKPDPDPVKWTDKIMAASALASALAAIAVACLTLRLIRVGRDQHKAALAALKVGEDSSKAAQSAAEAAILALDRPWVWVAEVQPHSRIPAPDKKQDFVRVLLRNYGKAPAVITMARAALFYSPGPRLAEAFEQAMGKMVDPILPFPEPGGVSRFIFDKGGVALSEESAALSGELAEKLDEAHIENGLILEPGDDFLPFVFRGYRIVDTDDSKGLPLTVVTTLYLIGMISYSTPNEDRETITFCYERRGARAFRRYGGPQYNKRTSHPATGTQPAT